MQLFDADFNPKVAPEQTNTSSSSRRTGSVSLLSNAIFVDTSSGSSSETTSNSNSPINTDSLLKAVRKEQLEPKFQTNLCKSLGINIEINESYLFGKKSWDEHYEYLIELRINEENWFIFRRYSKIRQMHEKCVYYIPRLIDLSSR